MEKLTITIFALLTLLVLVVLTVTAATLVQMPDNGKQIRVKAGEIIELALPEQAGTGYIWKFHRLDEAHFKILHTATKSLAEPNRVGGPMLQTWQIQTLAPGQARLSRDYLRPWEGRASAVNHFTVQVQID
jgi:predicted secreted protein